MIHASRAASHTCHHRTTDSEAPYDATITPSGRKATAVMGPECPSKLRHRSAARKSYTISSPLEVPTASFWEACRQGVVIAQRHSYDENVDGPCGTTPLASDAQARRRQPLPHSTAAAAPRRREGPARTAPLPRPPPHTGPPLRKQHGQATMCRVSPRAQQVHVPHGGSDDVPVGAALTREPRSSKPSRRTRVGSSRCCMASLMARTRFAGSAAAIWHTHTHTHTRTHTHTHATAIP